MRELTAEMVSNSDFAEPIIGETEVYITHLSANHPFMSLALLHDTVHFNQNIGSNASSTTYCVILGKLLKLNV